MVPVLAVLLQGCSAGKIQNEKIGDIDFTVVKEEDYPDEVKALIEKQKYEPFQSVFLDGAYMYVLVGYGEQNTTGYSIRIEGVYETPTSIVVDTNLLGPQPDAELTGENTFPLIVLKMKPSDKEVACV
ncbi:MAG: protease complex subunit PrcB family protein [Lachnospiraceae bacterium]|nr:protease complex subunit PrcB family protein [Lachnospiraceae bacterium]